MLRARSPRLPLVAALVLAATAGGCRRRPPPEERVDGWAIARAALTGGEHCFAGRSEYCLSDPAFVEAAVRPRLVDLYGGEMPERREHVDAVVRAAVIAYKKSLLRPENLVRVEELVEERYRNPKVSLEGDTVTIDLGVVPGRLEPHPATNALRLGASEHVVDGDWSRPELERTLLDYAAKYPEVRVVRVALVLPSANALVPRTYRWLRDERRLVVAAGEELRTTARLPSLEAISAPARSLRFADLARCKGVRTPTADDADPPSTCPVDEPPR